MKCEMQIALFNRKYGCKWNVVLIQFKLIEYKLHQPFRKIDFLISYNDNKIQLIK